MMKRFYLTICIQFIFAAVFGQGFIGSWKGSITVQSNSIELIFKIQKNEAGLIKAFMDSPAQMVYDLPFDKVEIIKDSIVLKISVANATFEGVLNVETSQIRGFWKQGNTFELNLDRTSGQGFSRPQLPKPPFDYTIEEVQFVNKAAKGIQLAGTLTYPKEKGRYPTIVLISGSGPQDRNSTILKHQPFWVLADFFTSQGYAVLRCDDRGFGQSEGDFATATTDDFVTDVEAAFQFLKKHPAVQAKKIGLVGHSEGGLIAQMVAAKNKKLAFVVLLAAPAVPGHQLMWQQNHDILLQSGLEDSLVFKMDQLNKALLEKAAEKDVNLTASDLHEAVKVYLDDFSEDEKEALQLENRAVMQKIMAVLHPWMRTFLQKQPKEYLSKISCPLLAVNGDKDIQVNASINLAAIEAVLKANKHPNFSILKMPGLNHLMQTCQSGAVSEYIEIEETFNADLMEKMNKWLDTITQP